MYFEWSAGLSATDKAQMLAILNAVARREGTNGMSRPLTDEEGAKFTGHLDEAIRRGDCHQLFARDERTHAIVAIATLEQIKMNPARAHVIDIKRMASAVEARGFGRFILEGWQVILEKCRKLGCDIVNIDVSEDGPYEMWRKLGFRVYAKIADYARVGERKLDGYFLHVYVDEALEILERFHVERRADDATSPPVPLARV